MSEIKPGDNRPLSELLRLASEEWVDHDAAARMLEELKTTFLEQRKAEMVAAHIGEKELPDSHAEREVKASKEYKDYIVKMVKSRTAANKAKVQVEYIKMLHWERQSSEANARAERRT